MCSAEVGISLPASLPHIHDRVMEAFTEPKVDDPLDLKPSTRTVGLAVFVGMILISLALGDAVTETRTIL